MKTGDSVRVLQSPYEMFEVGSEHSIYSVNGELIYLIDPFYQGTDQSRFAVWPFYGDELEAVE